MKKFNNLILLSVVTLLLGCGETRQNLQQGGLSGVDKSASSSKASLTAKYSRLQFICNSEIDSARPTNAQGTLHPQQTVVWDLLSDFDTLKKVSVRQNQDGVNLDVTFRLIFSQGDALIFETDSTGTRAVSFKNIVKLSGFGTFLVNELDEKGTPHLSIRETTNNLTFNEGIGVMLLDREGVIQAPNWATRIRLSCTLQADVKPAP